MPQEELDFQKIYFQLAPSPTARGLLREISKQLQLEPQEARLVDPDTWHLTVVHVGNLKTIWQQLITGDNDLSFENFKSSMQRWAQRQQQRVAGKTYQLSADGVDFFGGSASALSVTFTTDGGLPSDHRQAYSDLVATWTSLGINQPAMTLRSLPELKYAHALSPHVTLARGVNINTSLPEIEKSEALFTPMKFFYGLHE